MTFGQSKEWQHMMFTRVLIRVALSMKGAYVEVSYEGGR